MADQATAATVIGKYPAPDAIRWRATRRLLTRLRHRVPNRHQTAHNFRDTFRTCQAIAPAAYH